MKRTGFKKKVGKGLKRTRLKKKSKSEIAVLQTKIWELCKSITRRRYGNVCYTCGKEGLKGSNWHTGHAIPKASLGAFLKYDLRLLRPQCYYCNINLGGNGAVFYTRLVEEEGKKYVDKIFKDRAVTVKAIDHYKEILEEYKKIDENEQENI